MQRGAFDQLRKGGKGMSLQDIIVYVGQTKFVTDAMIFASEVWNIETMLENESYFEAGATTGEALSELVFICFRDIIKQQYYDSKLQAAVYKQRTASDILLEEGASNALSHMNGMF